jgi:hypothetical protein
LLSLRCLLFLGFNLGLGGNKVVAVEEELNKEIKIAGIHDQGCLDVGETGMAIFLSGPCPGLGGNGDSHDHLNDLKDRNDLGVEPFGLATNGHEEIVEIHDGMNRELG